MATSAMLSMEFNDGNGNYGRFISHFSELLQPPVFLPPAQSVTNDDLTVIALLSPFFTDRAGNVPQGAPKSLSTTSMAAEDEAVDSLPDFCIMGVYLSPNYEIGHSSTISLACLNEYLLRLTAAHPFKLVNTPIYNQIMATPIDQVAQVMMSINRDLRVTLGRKPTLTITRVSPEDIAIIKSKHMPEPSVFIDAFDLVKDRLIRKEPFLDNNDYAPAVYTNNGGDGSDDTIVFTGDYSFARYEVYA